MHGRVLIMTTDNWFRDLQEHMAGLVLLMMFMIMILMAVLDHFRSL
jgi:hypothetical protein